MYCLEKEQLTGPTKPTNFLPMPCPQARQAGMPPALPCCWKARSAHKGPKFPLTAWFLCHPTAHCRTKGRAPDVLCRVNTEHRHALVGLCKGSKAASCSSWAQGTAHPVHSRARLPFCNQIQPGFQGCQGAHFSHWLSSWFPTAQSQSSGALEEVFHGATASAAALGNGPEQRSPWAFLPCQSVPPLAVLIFALGSLPLRWLLQSKPSLLLWSCENLSDSNPIPQGCFSPIQTEPQETPGKSQLSLLPRGNNGKD